MPQGVERGMRIAGGAFTPAVIPAKAGIQEDGPGDEAMAGFIRWRVRLSFPLTREWLV